MKKIISILLLLSVCLSVLASCDFGSAVVGSADSSAEAGQTSPPPSDEAVLSSVTKQDREDIEKIIYAYLRDLLLDNAFEPEPATATYDGHTFRGIRYSDASPQRRAILETEDMISECGFISIAEKGTPPLEVAETDDDWHIQVMSDDTQQSYEVAFVTDCVYDTHFVFRDLYVRVSFDDLLNARYEILPNRYALYDLSLGEVYDLSRNEILYDPWMEYSPIEAEGLVTPYDFGAIQEAVYKTVDEQTAAGYRVEAITYIYIEPAAIQAFLASGETFERFFEVPVSDLFGDTAYMFTPSGYTEGGIIRDQYESAFVSSLKNYDWDQFLKKVAIGCGIVIVGAALAPVTGGCSFGVAMGVIVKSAITEAVVEALICTTVSVVRSCAAGDRSNEVVEKGLTAFLDGLANGWVTGAFVSSVMVNTQVIQACFREGTPIALANGELVPIESIHVGDTVWATDPITGETAPKPVMQVFRNETEEWIHVTVNGETVACTPEHPFYSPVKGWTAAIDLRVGDILVMLNGEYVVVEQAQHELPERPETTYNFEVEGFHTYYVGNSALLVHNKCTNPGGRHGGETHRAKVSDLKNELDLQKWSVFEKEKRIYFSGNKYRYPDIIAKKDGITRFYQVGKVTKSGQPIAREMRAIEDLQKVPNAIIYFIRYN